MPRMPDVVRIYIYYINYMGRVHNGRFYELKKKMVVLENSREGREIC